VATPRLGQACSHRKRWIRDCEEGDARSDSTGNRFFFYKQIRAVLSTAPLGRSLHRAGRPFFALFLNVRRGRGCVTLVLESRAWPPAPGSRQMDSDSAPAGRIAVRESAVHPKVAVLAAHAPDPIAPLRVGLPFRIFQVQNIRNAFSVASNDVSGWTMTRSRSARSIQDGVRAKPHNRRSAWVSRGRVWTEAFENADLVGRRARFSAAVRCEFSGPKRPPRGGWRTKQVGL